MKLYEIIIDDGKDVYKSLQVAKGKKDLINKVGGNGEIVRIKDVSKEYLTEESAELLDETLLKAGWGYAERKILCDLLLNFYYDNH